MFFKVPRPLLLASTSRYRRQLLERLNLPFECIAPAVDESRLRAEPAADLARRLAQAKASAVSIQRPDALVIGSDQVAVRGEDILGKPGTVERCIEQLERSSGRTVEFLTAVHLRCEETGYAESHLDRTIVHFRPLTRAEIERYVAADEPLDCAGGFKAESLGIALFDAIESTDPTALTGLPLSWLCGALRRAGIAVP